MDGNSRWQGWAALALAGLALFIALGGRQQQPAYVVQAPGAAYGDSAATAQSAANDAQRAAADARRAADDAQRGVRGNERGYGPAAPGFGDDRGGFYDQRGPDAYDHHGPWGYGRPHGFGPLGFLFGILKFVGFLLLGLLLLRFIGRRFGGRRGWGGPPWAYGHHGHHGRCGEGEKDQPAPERRDEPQNPTTGETTKL